MPAVTSSPAPSDAKKTAAPSAEPFRPIEDVREFFLLRDAEARSQKLPADLRATLQRDLAVARQKREAAETLWMAGSTAEALGLIGEACTLCIQCVERAGVDVTPKAAGDAAATMRPTLEGATLPALDAEVAGKDSELYFNLVAEFDQLHRALTPATLPKTDLVARRRARALGAVLAFALGVVAVVLALRTPKSLKAEASAVFSDKFAAAKAVDGRPENEWLLPDHMPGWVDVTVLPARRLKAIKILNAHNPPYNDRATKDWHIDVFSKSGQVLKSVDGTFAQFSDNPPWITVDLGVDNVARIRFEVRSWHATGGGVAEIEVVD